MTSAPTLATAAGAPSALTAFLRGVERRAAVFAELQCGDAVQGDNALAVAMMAFRGTASRTAIADWPHAFWILLLATPVLRQEPLAPYWRDGLAPLARLGRGPRAAVLLRLVAGLADAEAAAVLGIAQPSYRLALQRALPRRADGSADGAAWLALGDDARRAIRDVPAARLAALARQREAAITGRVAAPAHSRVPGFAGGDPASHARKWLGRLWAGVGVCVIALLATFFLPDAFPPRDGAPRVRIEPLPPAEPPAARYDDATALLTEPDFELLTDADSDGIPREVAFLAWLEARQAQAAASPSRDIAGAQANARGAAPETADAP